MANINRHSKFIKTKREHLMIQEKIKDMEMDKDDVGIEKNVSVLDGGDHELQQLSRVLAREPSTGIQSSFNSYHQGTQAVVPFEWELMPGTPKNLPEEGGILPPLSPPPAVLGSNLPKPRIDDQILQSHKESSSNWVWRKIKILNKEVGCHMISCKRGSFDHHDEGGKNIGESDGGDSRAFFECPSTTTASSSSSTYNSSNSRGAMESSSNFNVEASIHDGPFCCKTPWNITLVLDEENKKVYYCREHRTAFTLENSTMISKIMLAKAPSLDQEPSFRSYYRSSISDSSGVPFEWEKQPGTPIHPPETEVIPPPSPPPSVQSCGLSLPNIRVDNDDNDTIRRRPLISFFGVKSMKMLEDKESPGNLVRIWEEKSKRLSKLNPFRAHLCFVPRTLS